MGDSLSRMETLLPVCSIVAFPAGGEAAGFESNESQSPLMFGPW